MTKTNLEMFRGDTASFPFTAKRADGTTVINLTGAKVWMSARRSFTTPSYVFTKTSDDAGVAIVSAPAGTLKVYLDVNDTSGLPDETTTLVYDVQVKEADGTVTTVAFGDLVVDPDVTKEVV